MQTLEVLKLIALVYRCGCGSLGVKVDNKIVYQLLYHVCSLDCDSDEFKEIKDKVKIYANKFHRIEECGEIE